MNKPTLRLWLAAETYFPALGGGENHARLLAAALVERGVEVTILTRRLHADWPARQQLDGVTVRRLWPTGAGTLTKYATNIPLAAMVLRERRHYDAFLCCGFRAWGETALLARRVGKPCLLRAEVSGELNGDFAERRAGSAGWVQTAPVRAFLRRRRRAVITADRFVAISAAVRDEYLEGGVPAGKIVEIPNGIDLSAFRPTRGALQLTRRRELGLPESGVIVAYTGKLNRFKGLESLLDAWRTLHLGDNAHLLLVGSGGDQTLSIEAELRERAAAHPGVIFTGRVEDVAPYLQAADVFAFPSEAETFGISLLEAMASGLAVVATDIPALSELVAHGKNGLLVPSGESLALAAALGRLAGSPEERRRLGNEALSTASRFGIDTVADQYLSLLETLTYGAARPTHEEHAAEIHA